LLELSFFLVDNVSQELLLETLLCDNEIDNSTLCGNLWWIIWVQHFGLEIKLELERVIDIVTTQHNLETGTGSGDSSLEQWI
jgi:hypothetical protein